jgi:hypothetical protein
MRCSEPSPWTTFGVESRVTYAQKIPAGWVFGVFDSTELVAGRSGRTSQSDRAQRFIAFSLLRWGCGGEAPAIPFALPRTSGDSKPSVRLNRKTATVLSCDLKYECIAGASPPHPQYKCVESLRDAGIRLPFGLRRAQSSRRHRRPIRQYLLCWTSLSCAETFWRQSRNKPKRRVPRRHRGLLPPVDIQTRWYPSHFGRLFSHHWR